LTKATAEKAEIRMIAVSHNLHFVSLVMAIADA
jgi:hypothetical protein